VSIAFTFDAARHIARDASGRWIPSATQLIKAAGLGVDYSFVDEDALSRKSAIGSAVDYFARIYDATGDLDPTWLDDSTSGFFESWRGFRRVSGFVPLKVQPPRSVTVLFGLPYTWELDAIGHIGSQLYIVDRKASEVKTASHGFQTAGYEMGYFGTPILGRAIRAISRLKEDGSPGHLIPYNDNIGDAEMFICALKTGHRRIREGWLKEPQ
jgi:hypothetical protein